MISLHYDLTPEKMREVLSQVDAVIFSGGVDMHPRFYGQAVLPQCDDVDERRDLMELSLFEMAVQKNLPMLMLHSERPERLTAEELSDRSTMLCCRPLSLHSTPIL